MSPKILVSSCLIGKKCAYDGRARTVAAVKKLCGNFHCIDICPELFGGLGCPREVHEVVGGAGEDVLDGKARVLSFSGEDHTEQFKCGANAVLERALQNRIQVAILKSHSPSCGRGRIYTGRFDKTLRSGNGVTAALLLRHGIKVFTEEEVGEAELAVCG